MEDNTSKVYVEPHGSQPPLVSQSSGSGTQLFVINLCASIAPVSTTGRNIPGLENYKLYQVARVEDGRTRHRLRLGFFTNEAHAERVLTVVRQQYPTAFTASLGDEDRRFTRGYLPAAAATPAACSASDCCCSQHAAGSRCRGPCPETCSCRCSSRPESCTRSCRRSACRESRTRARRTPPVAAQAPAAAKPAAAKPAQPAKAVAKAPSDEVVEMTWEPDEETKAAVTSASLPKIKALTEAMGLDEMSWNDDPAPAAPVAAAPAPAPSKEPLAVGLLSGKFAALDTSKLKIKTTAPAPSPAPVASKPVTPPAPASVPPKLDTSASVRVPALTFSDPEPTPAAAQKSNGSGEPYHVGKGMNIEEVDAFELDLYDERAGQGRRTRRSAAGTCCNKQSRCG